MGIKSSNIKIYINVIWSMTIKAIIFKKNIKRTFIIIIEKESRTKSSKKSNKELNK